MSTSTNYPTDLTSEERDVGFRCVDTIIFPRDRIEYGHQSFTTVAVLDLAPSYRLIKKLDKKFSPTDPGFGYQLQSFGYNKIKSEFNRHPGSPIWDEIWDYRSPDLQHALQRFRSEPHPLPHWQIAKPPIDPEIP